MKRRSLIKVLYLSYCMDGTGWSNLAIENMKALNEVGVDVVSRSIRLNNNPVKVPEIINELEAKNSHDPDIVIQNLLPYHYEYFPVKKNIALYTSETSDFKHSDWPSRINMLAGEAWVLNQQSREAGINSGVTLPINVVNPPTDISKYRKSYEPLGFRNNHKDQFIFYTIGEFNNRKNLKDLIIAFHLEFAPEEPAQLLIKTTPVGVKSADQIKNFFDDIKNKLKLYVLPEQYKQEMIVVDYWSEDDLMRLNASCDVFVCTSMGEAWSIPSFTAMALGKPTILPRSTGFLDYANDETSWLIDVSKESVYDPQNGFQDIFTSREFWYKPSIIDLRFAMRQAFENRDLCKQKGNAGYKRGQEFSYEKIGNQMKMLLEKSL